MSTVTNSNDNGTSDNGRFRGSPDRVPGARVRALVELLLRRDLCSSRWAVAHELRGRLLEEQGLKLHVRTLRRHLSGEVSSVPPEVQESVTHLALERLEVDSDDELDDLLEASGLDPDKAARKRPLVRTGELLPLVQLWLHLNPTSSRRALACRLQEDLERSGVSFAVGSLESMLSGGGLVVRREVFQTLLRYLSQHGIKSVAAVKKATKAMQDEIESSLESRSFTDPDRFQLLCFAWQLRRHEASTRNLSELLQERLRERGIEIGIDRLQKSVAGRTRRVRRGLEESLEELLAEELPEGVSVDEEIERVRRSPESIADLFWVEAEPIARLAEEWLDQRPDSTSRQLAIRISETLKEMGYDRGHNGIQPVLRGWKKKTRGFVYRATLAQFEDIDILRIPDVHILEPHSRLRFVSAAREPREETMPKRTNGHDVLGQGGSNGVSARQYVLEMREYLPAALSRGFVSLAAYRAERLFGIPRADAAAMIRGEMEAPEH